MTQERAHKGWLTVNLIAQLTFGLMAMTICLPSMQEWPATFGAGQAAVQLTFSGYLAAYGGMQLVYGPLSDRIGRKPVLLAGLVIACAGSAMAVFAPTLGWLIAARVVQGIGCAASIVIGRVLVQDFFEGRERTRVMAWVGMTMGLVPPTATLLGGQLHVRVGWQANFAVLGVLALVLLAAAWRLPVRRVQAAGDGHWLAQVLAGYATLARVRVFAWYVLVLSATAATFYAFLGGAPIVLAHYGVTPDRVGWYIMAPPLAYILGNIATTRLIRTRSEQAIMLLGQWATLASVSIVLALGLAGLSSPLALSLPLLLLGIGHGLLVPPALVGTVGLVPALAGSAAAVAGVMQQVGGAIGGYTVGLVPHTGQTNLAAAMLFWTLCAFAALLMLRRAVR
jgi:MFS transporter, DHA1 family, multidrug resistance protein